MGWLVGWWGLRQAFGGLVPHQLAMIRVSREIQRTCRFSPPQAMASDLLHLPFIACFLSSLVAPVVQQALPTPNLAFTAILLGRALLHCFLSGGCLFPGVLMRCRGLGSCFWVVARVSTTAFSASAFVHSFFGDKRLTRISIK